MKDFIVAEDLCYVYMPDTPYESRALADVSLSIEKGSFVGIVGSTGSGKSTLIQHFNGLLRPTSGKVVVDGLDLSDRKLDLKQLRSRVGLVFQYPEYQLFEETVEADIAFGPVRIGFPPQRVGPAVKKAMAFMDLDYEAFRLRSPFSLSGGEMRRVAIAGILAMEPSVLILDEPTAGLDPRSRQSLLKKLKELNEKDGVTVIMVSHSMDEIVEMADRLMVMSAGKVVASGTVEEVFQDPGLLLSASLTLPQCTRLLVELKDRGFDVPVDRFRIEDCAGALKELFGK